jgi:hypothetical protein
VIQASATAGRNWRDTLVVSFVTAALVVSATLFMFSAFMFYDDEGYVLISLRNFAQHGGLYSDVYTQYGPFPYVMYYILHAIGLPITHTVGRMITIGLWAGTAITCAALGDFGTRKLAVRLLVLSAVFVYLWVMVHEPSHPGGIIVLLTAIIALAGYRAILADRLCAWAVSVGLGAAVLMLTKINVGVFAVYSACTWALLHHRDQFPRRWAPVVVATWSVFLPLLLMRPLLGTEWVQSYAYVFATSAISLVFAIALAGGGRIGWGALFIGLGAAAGALILVLGVILLRGTRAADLLEGMLLGPLRQPVNFTLRYVWPSPIHLITALSFAVFLGACVLRVRRIAWVNWIVAIMRIVTTMGLLALVVCFPAIRPDYPTFGFLMPCLWLFVWPLTGEDGHVLQARAWIALLLLGQCLHVFPVPGSQIAWGSVLAIPLAALGANDAIAWVARSNQGGWLASRGAARVVQLTLSVLAAVIVWRFGDVSLRYREGLNLGQPGAEMIRLPDKSAGLFRVMTLNAAMHADVLFSLPGMFSLNLWSGVPTPTHANVTHWFSLLDSTRQQAIIDVLEAHPRACIIVDRGHVEYLDVRRLTPRGLLHDYIAKEFEPAFVVDRFEFCVHRGRKLAPFMLAELLSRNIAASKDAVPERNLLKCTLLLPPDRAVASVELSTPGGLLILNAGNARVEAAAANAHGEPIGPVQAQAWPLMLPRPNVALIYFNGDWQNALAGETTIILRDSYGDEVGIARLRHN